jgi:hypothetical protein
MKLMTTMTMVQQNLSRNNPNNSLLPNPSNQQQSLSHKNSLHSNSPNPSN